MDDDPSINPAETAPPPDEGADRGAPASSPSSTWTIPLLCLGIGLIACCLIIPAADDNRRLAYEKEKLKRDLEYVNDQVSVNDAFLHKLAGDPALAERLATRQMKLVREGTNVLRLEGTGHENLSPFELVTVPPPEPLPLYRPVGGRLAAICRSAKSQLYMIGAGLMMIAVALVLGPNPTAGPRRL